MISLTKLCEAMMTMIYLSVPRSYNFRISPLLFVPDRGRGLRASGAADSLESSNIKRCAKSSLAMEDARPSVTACVGLHRGPGDRPTVRPRRPGTAPMVGRRRNRDEVIRGLDGKTCVRTSSELRTNEACRRLTAAADPLSSPCGSAVPGRGACSRGGRETEVYGRTGRCAS